MNKDKTEKEMITKPLQTNELYSKIPWLLGSSIVELLMLTSERKCYNENSGITIVFNNRYVLNTQTKIISTEFMNFIVCFLYFWFCLLFYLDLFFSFFGTTTVFGQGLPILLLGLAFSNLLITHSRIISPTYGGMVHLGLEPMTDM